MKRHSRLVAAIVAAALLAMLAIGLAGAVHVPEVGIAGSALGVSVGILLFFILSSQASNRREAPADGETRERALAFGVRPDEAVLYFVRTGFAGSAVGVDIDVDGTVRAQLKSPRFTCLTVAPGMHRLEARIGQGTSRLAPAPCMQTASLGAGSITVLHVRIARSMMSSALAFEPWSMQDARTRLAKMKMVADVSAPPDVTDDVARHVVTPTAGPRGAAL